jgi:hypothetical protein
VSPGLAASSTARLVAGALIAVATVAGGSSPGADVPAGPELNRQGVAVAQAQDAPASAPIGAPSGGLDSPPLSHTAATDPVDGSASLADQAAPAPQDLAPEPVAAAVGSAPSEPLSQLMTEPLQSLPELQVTAELTPPTTSPELRA